MIGMRYMSDAFCIHYVPLFTVRAGRGMRMAGRARPAFGFALGLAHGAWRGRGRGQLGFLDVRIQYIERPQGDTIVNP